MKTGVSKAVNTSKKTGLWFFLWTKRLIKRPFFLFTLLLIPLTVLFIRHSFMANDAILHIAVYVDDQPDSLAGKIAEELMNVSQKNISFYRVSSKETLKRDVRNKKSVCGYVFPKKMEEQLKIYEENKTPFLPAIQSEGEMTNNIINEIVLGKIYETYSYQILEKAITKKDKKATTNSLSFLKRNFSDYLKHELLFRFEYASGKENKWLNGSTPGILLMPMRGIISVLIFLSCMAGNLLWYEDKKSGISLISIKKMKQYCSFFSLFVPAVYAGITGIISIRYTGISENISSEILSMICFLFLCISLVYFFKTICHGKELFLSAIPVWIIGSLIFCPVFIDLSIYLPVIKPFRYLFPTYYYLCSLYNTAHLWYMFFYGSFLILAGHVLKMIFKKQSY